MTNTKEGGKKTPLAKRTDIGRWTEVSDALLRGWSRDLSETVTLNKWKLMGNH